MWVVKEILKAATYICYWSIHIRFLHLEEAPSVATYLLSNLVSIFADGPHLRQDLKYGAASMLQMEKVESKVWP